MQSDAFAPDCGNCAALCCLALAFDKGPQFGFDKPAGLPCRHLASGGRCTIHARLDDEGFGGCASYSCLGAGQIVVQSIFAGASWQDDPSLSGPMMEAFSTLREVQDMRAQLVAAEALPLSPADVAARQALDRALAPPEGWTKAALDAFDLPAARAAFRRFVAGLRQTMAPAGKTAAVGRQLKGRPWTKA
jgi:hypothetical protein